MLWFRMFLLSAVILLFYSILFYWPVELKRVVFDKQQTSLIVARRPAKCIDQIWKWLQRAPLNTTATCAHTHGNGGEQDEASPLHCQYFTGPSFNSKPVHSCAELDSD